MKICHLEMLKFFAQKRSQKVGCRVQELGAIYKKLTRHQLTSVSQPEFHKSLNLGAIYLALYRHYVFIRNARFPKRHNPYHVNIPHAIIPTKSLGLGPGINPLGVGGPVIGRKWEI